jgi:hypothetical protein
MEWSNSACLGYAIMAAQEAGFTDEQIQALIRKMHYMHDMRTLEEAKEAYQKTIY